jgi:hypothetical protein
MTAHSRLLLKRFLSLSASVSLVAGCLPSPLLGGNAAPGSSPTSLAATMVSGVAKVGSVPLANARIYVHDPLTDAPPLEPGTANVARLEFTATAFKTDGSGAFKIPLAIKPGQVAYVYISDGKQALGALVAGDRTTYRSTGKVAISDANPLQVDVDSTLQVRALAKPLEVLGSGVPLFLLKGKFSERMQLLAKTIDVMAASAAEASRATLPSLADNAAATALAERMTHADPAMLAGLKVRGSQSAASAFATNAFQTLGTYDSQIQQLYVAYYGRPADPTGLAYWDSVIASAVAAGGGADTAIASIAKTFGTSAEYLAQFANLTDAQKVTRVYQNLFSHDPDPSGLMYWTQKLQTGALTMDQIVRAISESAVAAGNTDGAAYQAKVAAATAFTAALDTTAEILGYTGQAANDLAKAFISSVTSDATLATAIAPAALNATVTAVTDAGNRVPGRTFSLTTGVDTIGEFDTAKKASCIINVPSPNTLSSLDQWPARCVLNYGPPEPFALGDAEKKILADGILYLDSNGGSSLGESVRRATSGTTGDSVGEKTTFNGKVFDDTSAPLDGVAIAAKSLNPALPYSATTTTAGGSYAFNNAPVGVEVQITASKAGYTTRAMTGVLKANKAGDPSVNRFDFGSDGSPSQFQQAPGLSDRPNNLTVPLSGPDAAPDLGKGVVQLKLNALYNAGVFRQKLADWLPELTRDRLPKVASLLKDGRSTWVRDLSYTTIDQAFRDDGVAITTAFVPGTVTDGPAIDYTIALPNQLLRTTTTNGTTQVAGIDTYGFGSTPSLPFQVGSRGEVFNSDSTVAWYTFKLQQPTYRTGKAAGGEIAIPDSMINGLPDHYDMQLPWPSDATFRASFPNAGQRFTGWIERRYTYQGAVIVKMVSQNLTLAQEPLETTQTKAALGSGGSVLIPD